MSKNLMNDLDKYQDSKTSEQFKRKPKNPKNKHVKTKKRKEETLEYIED